MSNEYIGIQEAAELSKKSVQTIRRAIKSKTLKFKKSKTPQGFNYMIEKASLCELYGIKLKEEKREETSKAKTSTKSSKKSEDINISADDFKNFTQTLERMMSQHSEERQSFMRLVNTLQERVFFLENQIKLLEEPKKKWYQFW